MTELALWLAMVIVAGLSPSIAGSPDVIMQGTSIAGLVGWSEETGGAGVRTEIRVSEDHGQVLSLGVRHAILRLVDSGSGFEAQAVLYWFHAPGAPFAAGEERYCHDWLCAQEVRIPIERDWSDLAERYLALTNCHPARFEKNADGRTVISSTGGGIDVGSLNLDIFEQGARREYRCNGPLLLQSTDPTSVEFKARRLYEQFAEIRDATIAAQKR